MAYKVKSVAIYFIYICTSILICLYVYYGVQEKENFKESPGFKKSTSNQCDSVLRPKKLDIRQEIWQVAKVTKSNSSDDAVYSMHAYYDNRAMMKGKYMRINTPPPLPKKEKKKNSFGNSLLSS